jgi:hypothetical protein
MNLLANLVIEILERSASNCVPLSIVIAFGTPKRQTIFCQKHFWIVAKVIVAKGFALIHLEKYSTATTTYLKLPCAGGSGPSNPGPIFAMARLVVSAESMTKVASNLLHIFGNFRTFEPNLLRPKLPSANKIPVEKPFLEEV